MKQENINTPVSAEDLELMRQDLPLAFCVGMELVYRGHKSLGEKGKLKDSLNQFNEMALRADVQAEDAFLYRLRLWAVENDVTVYTRGEESGEKTLSREQVSKDKRLLVLDGLDGSANYLQKTDWGYGTMAAIADGKDPTYNDFKTAAIMMPEEGWTILAQRGKGVYVISLETGETVKLPRFEDEAYDEHKILSDNYFEEAKKLLGKKQEIWPRTGSTAATVVAIAIGSQIKDDKFPRMNEGWQALVDVTRKGNLEQPILYRIITELGGVMVDKDGVSIGIRKFRTWGQKEKLPVISARSAQIAQKIRRELGLVTNEDTY